MLETSGPCRARMGKRGAGGPTVDVWPTTSMLIVIQSSTDRSHEMEIRTTCHAFLDATTFISRGLDRAQSEG